MSPLSMPLQGSTAVHISENDHSCGSGCTSFNQDLEQVCVGLHMYLHGHPSLTNRHPPPHTHTHVHIHPKRRETEREGTERMAPLDRDGRSSTSQHLPVESQGASRPGSGGAFLRAGAARGGSLSAAQENACTAEQLPDRYIQV